MIVAAETITSLEVFLNSAKVGTMVRTPGDFNAFSLAPAYRATGGHPVPELVFAGRCGGLRKDPRPVAGALPPFFANLLPEDRLREAMEKHHAAHVRPGMILIFSRLLVRICRAQCESCPVVASQGLR